MKYQPSTRFRPYVKAGLQCGHWEPIDKLIDHGAHSLLRHKRTGKTVTYGLHDGGNEWNGPRNMARAMQDICGCRFIEARGRKQSRKKVVTSGFSVEVACREQRGWHESSWGERVDDLHAEHAETKALLGQMAAAGNRTAAAQARELVIHLTKIEAELSALHQPFIPFRL